MREILFKGIRVDNSEWIEGFVYRNEDKNGNKHLFIIEDETYRMSQRRNTIHEIKTDTLCQFTGLPDKNKNKAFEGDYDSDGNILVWCDVCSGWQFGQIYIPIKELVVNCHACDGNFFLQDHIYGFEIIGNIHD